MTGRLGAKTQAHAQAAIELVMDMIGSCMTRGEIHRGYASEVAERDAARAKAASLGIEALSPLERNRAVALPLRTKSESQIDDYIRAAKDRLQEEASPGKAKEIKARIAATYRIAQKRLLGSKDSEGAARVAEKEAKLFGLIVDRQRIEGGGQLPRSLADLTEEQLERAAATGEL